MREKMSSVLEAVKNNPKVVGISTALSVGMLPVLTFAEEAGGASSANAQVAEFQNSLSGFDLSMFGSMFTKVVGVALPVAIGIIAIKKGFGWFKGMIKGM